MRKTVYKMGLAICLFGAASGLSACHPQGGEPDNVPPADAASVSSDSAVADTAIVASANTADTN